MQVTSAGVYGKALAALGTAKHQQRWARQPATNFSGNAAAAAGVLAALLHHTTLLCRMDTGAALSLHHLPAAFSTSLAMGTVEFTGLEMISMIACSQ